MVKCIQNFTAELKGTQVWSWLIATTDRKQLWLVLTVYLDTILLYKLVGWTRRRSLQEIECKATISYKELSTLYNTFIGSIQLQTKI